MDVYNTTPINANAHHSVGVTFPESTASGSSSDVNIQCQTIDNKSYGWAKFRFKNLSRISIFFAGIDVFDLRNNKEIEINCRKCVLILKIY